MTGIKMKEFGSDVYSRAIRDGRPLTDGVVNAGLAKILNCYKRQKEFGEMLLSFPCPNGKWALLRCTVYQLRAYIDILRSVKVEYKYSINGMVYSGVYPGGYTQV